MNPYEIPRVTAVETLSTGQPLRLPGIPLWIARQDANMRILGGFRFTDAQSRTEPVSLVKVYV